MALFEDTAPAETAKKKNGPKTHTATRLKNMVGAHKMLKVRRAQDEERSQEEDHTAD